ncbi:MAG: cob(I)yrinic acid a,c-diamide adenosyltransferase [Planctomycetota bacterium]|nr:MAG: cob(I)yrinic acid a,c-diamide adenosyltransferase [Planctomycetota bacterium]
MSYYTKDGNGGETSLFNGIRVPKDDPRIITLGDLDELHSFLGWCRCICDSRLLASRIERIQHDLYLLCSELARPAGAEDTYSFPTVNREHCSQLETWIDEASEITGPINKFVIPGGTELASRLHIARTCCRRAERSVVALSRSVKVRAEVFIYLNRLSDLLFGWSCQVNREGGVLD